MTNLLMLWQKFKESSEVIGILQRSTAWYSRVEQRRPRLVLTWVTVLVCQFLLIVFRMTEALGTALAAVTLYVRDT